MFIIIAIRIPENKGLKATFLQFLHSKENAQFLLRHPVALNGFEVLQCGPNVDSLS